MGNRRESGLRSGALAARRLAFGFLGGLLFLAGIGQHGQGQRQRRIEQDQAAPVMVRQKHQRGNAQVDRHQEHQWPPHGRTQEGLLSLVLEIQCHAVHPALCFAAWPPGSAAGRIDGRATCWRWVVSCPGL